MIARTSIARFAPIATAAVIVASGLLIAGPLNPPAGPVTATSKTLADVEPRTAINAANTPGDADSHFKITQPGSYYLTGNVIGTEAKHGIEIAADSVTIDLNGFAVLHSGQGLDGVTTSNVARVSITVRNGAVSGWANNGIDLDGTGHIIQNVHTRVNSTGGIAVGNHCVISNCHASGNIGVGITTGINSTCSNSAASNNSTGILTDNGCTILNCAASNNAANGITVGSACTVTSCVTNANAATGIACGNGATISGCSAYNNSNHGINAFSASAVINCTVHANVLDGIRCSSSCVIRGNTCVQNGFSTGDGAGIHASGTDNRIEGNNCINADRGIDVDSSGNIIIGNTCSANTTNWVFAVSNYHGPIIDRTSVATPAVNGPAAAGTLTSSDPHANFSY